MHHRAWPRRGARGEHDDGVAVLVGGPRQDHRPAIGVQGWGAAGRPGTDGGHGTEFGEVRQGQPGPAGERPGPSGDGLGGGIGEDDIGPGQGEPGTQHVRSGAGIEHRGPRAEPVHGEHHRKGPRSGPYGDTDGASPPDAPLVQGGGVAVGECGEVPARGPGAYGTGPGGAEDGRPVGADTESTGEEVEHQRGSSPWLPGPLSRYQRAVPSRP